MGVKKRLKDNYARLGKTTYGKDPEATETPEVKALLREIKKDEDLLKSKRNSRIRTYLYNDNFYIIYYESFPCLAFNVFQLVMWFFAGFTVIYDNCSFFDLFNNVIIAFEPYKNMTFEIQFFRIINSLFIFYKVLYILENMLCMIKVKYLYNQVRHLLISSFFNLVMIGVFYWQCFDSYRDGLIFEGIHLNPLGWIYIGITVYSVIWALFRNPHDDEEY